MNRRVIVFSLGWACGPDIVRHIAGALGKADPIFLYDWRRMPSPEELHKLTDNYPERYLVAWSFGVWAAEQLLGGVEFTRAVALNGTPLPADERLGIGSKRLRITLRGLPARGMEEFDRRACGEHYEKLKPLLNPRTLEENIAELDALIRAAERPYTPALRWDAALAGSGDLIFPPENMVRYWGDKAKIVPLPHYPFGDTDQIKLLLNGE